MSNKDSKTESSLTNQQKKDKKLWERSKIDFSLDSKVFPDNKINGAIIIKPKRAFELIEKFVLVINNSPGVQFDRNFRKISVFGFDPTGKSLSVYIEAIPKSKALTPRKSERQSFVIIRQCFSLSPTVSFNWTSSAEKDPKVYPSIIIKWFHIGDKAAQKYVLCLDDKEIQYIREPTKNDLYEVEINNMKPDKKEHTVQIKARLNNGKDTYQSDPITFTVPGKRTEHNSEVINVSRRLSTSDDSENITDEDEEIEKIPEPQIKSQQPDDITSTIPSCSCRKPHETFPGIPHYLTIRNNKPSTCQSTALTQGKRRPSSREEDTGDTDNDDQNEEEDEDDEQNEKEHTDDDDDVVVK